MASKGNNLPHIYTLQSIKPYIERKSTEPIALPVKDGHHVKAMQRIVSAALWDDNKMIAKYRGLINDDIGSADGALIFGESGFIKKGQDSVGVARQYCGTIGKIDNCQVSVFAAYVFEHEYALVDKRLFVPQEIVILKYYQSDQI